MLFLFGFVLGIYSSTKYYMVKKKCVHQITSSLFYKNVHDIVSEFEDNLLNSYYTIDTLYSQNPDYTN